MPVHDPTPVSSVDLNSGWRVSLAIVRRLRSRSLHSWTEDEATQFFSGTAVYERSVDLDPKFLSDGRHVSLDLGEGRALPVQPTRNGMQTWFDPPVARQR